ncbi:Myb-Like DNA-Binding protein, partial [Euroglyphus maynei]
MQHNHLSHGHLLHEIYDISNKRNLLSHYGPTGGSGIQIRGTGPMPQIPSAIPVSVPGGIPLMTLHPGMGTGVPPGQHFQHIGAGAVGYHHPSSSSLTSSNHHHYYGPIQQSGHTTNSQKILVDGQFALSSSNASTTISTAGSRAVPSNQQEMVIETIDDSVEDGYNPHFEAISPTPQDESRISPLTSLKDQILSSINACDRQIQTIEVDINTLKLKAVCQQLEAATRKQPIDSDEEEKQKNGVKTEPTLVQKIIQENTLKAKKAHQHLYRLLGTDDNPLVCIIHSFIHFVISNRYVTHNNEHHQRFRPKLIDLIVRYKKDVAKEQQAQAEKYDQQMIEWLKKVEKIESNPVKKQRDAKIRESFEKHFPEIKKQREDRERVQRNSTQQHRIRSDAELEEIMDGLQHQELEDKKMRSYIVIPPIMFTRKEFKHHVPFDNQNGYLQDPMALYKEIRNINIWTEGEKEIFREKYLINPKKFGIIAQYLERKSIADCIHYYYLSKKHENYKQLLRKHVKKRTRAMIKAQQNLVSQRGSPHLINNNQSQQSSTVSGLDGSSGPSTVNRQYPISATSVILPYSIPLTSSIATITFSMSSSSTANSYGDNSARFSAISSTNGPSIVTSQVNSASADSSVINRCDNSDNNNVTDLANGTLE